jgi:FMN phosphatase YigB (HAD superfamily)
MKPLLFIDFDGTLCHDRFWRSLKQNEIQKVQDHLFVHNKEMVFDWMIGKYTSEEVNQFVADATGLQYDYLWKVFMEDCQTMKVAQSDLEKIKGLSNFYTTILMTDNMDCFSRFISPSLKLEEYFDKVINSYDTKESKNTLFPKLVDKTVDRAENILIDNSPKTCAVFNELGGTIYLASKDEPLSSWLDRIILRNTQKDSF